FAPITLLSVADIAPDPHNRKAHSAEALQLLADSIRADGLLQPIVVRKVPEAGEALYQLVAGERRWLACQLLGWPEIPARVVDDPAGATATRKRLAENFHREDLTPIEKARDLEQLFKDGLTQTEVAAFVGAKDQSTISNMMRLLKLPKKVQDWLQDGSLTAAHGKALLRWEGRQKLIEAIAERAIDQGASSKALETGLPFAEELEEDGIVFDFGYLCRGLACLPEKWRKDTDFTEIEDQWGGKSVACLDPNKGKLVAKELEAAAAARRTQERQGAGSSSGRSASLMTSAEIAERKRTIERNKAARAAIAATQAAAVGAVKDWTELHDAEPAMEVLVDAALEHFQNRNRLDAALKLLGLKTARTKLGVFDSVRATALAVALRRGEEAARFGGPVPEEAKTLAGGAVKGPTPPKPPAKAKDAPTKPARKTKRARITDDTRVQVKRLVEAGKTGAAIAKAVGISLPSVQHIKRQLGLVRRAA
ncbi:MAG: ParB/RepB/Spo0J family partition protein, partial [Elusimicrobia bacterium]|nr:ParB/RepB/Spo0J family partition protein [Elusimicrobiota bacterium]